VGQRLERVLSCSVPIQKWLKRQPPPRRGEGRASEHDGRLARSRGLATEEQCAVLRAEIGEARISTGRGRVVIDLGRRLRWQHVAVKGSGSR
jgi:hypothetical protein